MLNQKIEEMKHAHDKVFKNAHKDFIEQEKELTKRCKRVEEELEKFKIFSEKELKLKEILLKRNQEYCEILKRELVIAKNIIKNPHLLEYYSKDDKFEVYKYHQNVSK